MFLSSYEKLREKLLHKKLINLVHLGSHAFDEINGEVVQTSSFVFCNENEARVIYYLKSHDSISTQQAMELCEYKTRAGARKLLDKMIQNDILRKTGSGPSTKYIFNDNK